MLKASNLSYNDAHRDYGKHMPRQSLKGLHYYDSNKNATSINNIIIHPGCKIPLKLKHTGTWAFHSVKYIFITYKTEYGVGTNHRTFRSGAPNTINARLIVQIGKCRCRL